MKAKLLILIVLLCLAYSSSQAEKKLSFGGGVSYGLLHYNSSFESIGEIPSCCGEYTTGNGKSLNFNAYMITGFNKTFDFSLNLSASRMNSDMTTLEQRDIYDGTNSSTIATIEHTMLVDYTRLNLRPSLIYKTDYGFDFFGGVNFDFRFGGELDQIEKIKSPGYIRYDDDTRSRLDYKGDLDNLNLLGLGLNIGVRYLLPMDYWGRLSFAPEISYDFYPTNLVGDLNGNGSWMMGGLNVGASVQYRLLPLPEQPQYQLPGENLDDESLAFNINKPIYKIDASLDVELINPNDKIVVENLISTTYAALLNYIFFDENSSEMTKRFTLLERQQAKRFEIDDLRELENLEIYHNLLNVIGRRMITYPYTDITLVGCNSGEGDEADNLELSRARSETIKDYLVNIWKIDPSRIGIAARNLPENVSDDVDFGAEENRRVEIQTDYYELLEPIQFIERIKIVPEDVQLIFYPTAKAEAGLKDWHINVTQSGKLLKSFSGVEEPGDKFVWNIQMDDQESIPDSDGPLDVNFIVRDNDWQEYAISTKKDVFNKPTFKNFEDINVEQIEIKKTRVEKFNLILFGFDESEIKDHNLKIVELIKSKMAENSTIKIEGFTDLTGDDEYNKKLSKRRALELAKKMQISSDKVEGLGSSKLLYRNDLPEGRYYCRTVIVTIETPIE